MVYTIIFMSSNSPIVTLPMLPGSVPGTLRDAIILADQITASTVAAL
jgi:hypothetical protein